MITPPTGWLYSLACVIGFVGGGLAIVLGLIGVAASSAGWLIVAGGFALLIAVTLMTVVPSLLQIETSLTRELGELRELKNGIAQQVASLQLIADNTGLSDVAKSLVHRDRELEALRTVIREDIRGQRWEAALGLIDQVEQRLGYMEGTDAIREELDNARGDAIQAKLVEAIEVIEGHFAEHDWVCAQGVIDRLLQALPGNAKVTSLQDRMKLLKEQHKQELTAVWQEAIHRSDTDQAIEVLRELDQYLSPAEAHGLQSSARHVFKEKLLQLGVQFRFAVTEKRWADALATGLELVRDFPNARMANEVREALDTLRERACQHAATPGVETVQS